MNDQDNTKDELIIELQKLRQKNSSLKTYYDKNITKRKEAEEALQESKDRIQAMFQTIPDLMFRMDRQGVFLDYKADVGELYTQSDYAIIGKRNRDITPIEFADLVDLKILATLETGTLQTFEYNLPMPGRGMRFYEARMAVSGTDEVTAIVRDITERKLAEELMNESEEKFRSITEQTSDLISIIEARGTITYASPASKTLFQFDPEEMCGRNFIEFLDEPEIPKALEVLSDLIKGSLGIRSLEFSMKRKDGSIFIGELNASKFQQGFMNGILVVIHDITERKQVEQKINLKNEELLKLNGEKDKFFSIIAHDLRGPFNGFLGLTQIMSEELSSLTMEELQKMAVSMEKSASNLFRLLENLLNWARIQQGLIPFNPLVVQLLPIVDESIAILLDQAKIKGIFITKDISADLSVFADRDMMQTIIRNLVSNALKFTPKGGKVTISASTGDDNNVVVAIKDTGIGMSSEMVDNLFQLDVQINRPGTDGESSSGLGLLLCKEFVEKHGGKIWVESEEGVGSTFYFTLPLNSADDIISSAKPDIKIPEYQKAN